MRKRRTNSACERGAVASATDVLPGWVAEADRRLDTRMSERFASFHERVALWLLFGVIGFGLIGTVVVHVAFGQLIADMSARIPNRSDWTAHVRSSLRGLEWSVLWRGWLALLAMYLLSGGLIVLRGRIGAPKRLCRRILKSPRRQAAAFVLSCLDSQSFGRVGKKFFIVLVLSVMAVSAIALLSCKIWDVSREVYLRGASLFFPVAISVPFGIAAASIFALCRKLLGRIEMADAEVRRFYTVRLLEMAQSVVVFLMILTIIVGVFPYVGGAWTYASQGQMVKWADSLVQGAPADLVESRRDEIAQGLERLRSDLQEHPLGVEHWRELIWPELFRAVSGTTLCIAAILLFIGLVMPRAQSEWHRPLQGLASMFGLGLVLSTVAGLFFGYAPGWGVVRIAGYVTAFLVVFMLTYVVSFILDAGRRLRTCPYCERSYETDWRNCPLCGINFDVSSRSGEGEFLVSGGSDVVHHRSCALCRLPSAADWRPFKSLPEALAACSPDWRETAKPCQRCLGLDPRWKGDPVFEAARRWAHRLSLDEDQ